VLELELVRRNIPYVEFGELKFLEAAHVKDVLAFVRLLENPRDRVAGRPPQHPTERLSHMGLRRNRGARTLSFMRQLSLEIDEAADLVLARLASQWGMTPGRVVGLLCQPVDHELMAQISRQLIDTAAANMQPGIASLPARRRFKRDDAWR